MEIAFPASLITNSERNLESVLNRSHSSLSRRRGGTSAAESSQANTSDVNVRSPTIPSAPTK
jgi:hypothetical protein